jgi:hypothetical protein
MYPNRYTDAIYAQHRADAFEDTRDPLWPYLLTWGLLSALAGLFYVTLILQCWR